MTEPLPDCRTIHVVAFRGDRSASFARAFLQSLDDQKHRHGPGLSPLECLLFAGHTGVSIDGGSTVFGFNPDPGDNAAWDVMEQLKNGDWFPGIVHDDTPVFAAAQHRGLTILVLEVVLPEPAFVNFAKGLDAERRQSQYSYGYPNGDGDCNCTTWLERLGLPLLTGRMDEFTSLPGFVSNPNRRFGRCV